MVHQNMCKSHQKKKRFVPRLNSDSENTCCSGGCSINSVATNYLADAVKIKKNKKMSILVCMPLTTNAITGLWRRLAMPHISFMCFDYKKI